MSIGLQFLIKEFNYTPHVAWLTNIKSYSKDNIRILSQMGIKYIIISEIDEITRQERINNKELEFIWKTSENSNVYNICYIIDNICSYFR